MSYRRIATIALALAALALNACGTSSSTASTTTTTSPTGKSWAQVKADSTVVQATLAAVASDSDAGKLIAMVAGCSTGQGQVATWQADVATIPAAAIRVPYSKAVALISQGLETCAGDDMTDALTLFGQAKPYLDEATAAIAAGH